MVAFCRQNIDYLRNMKNNAKLSESVIYSAIREHGKNLQYVGDAMNMHRITLSRKLSKETIQLNELRQIAQILDIRVKDLFDKITFSEQ